MNFFTNLQNNPMKRTLLTIPSLIIVTLKKFNNQSRQYDPYRTIQVAKHDAKIATQAIKAMDLKPVKEFALYQWEIDGEKYELYSLSPFVFDHIESQQLHMT
jgi:hypothetical protein